MCSALPRRGVILFDTLTAVRAFEDAFEDRLGRNQVRPAVVEFSLGSEQDSITQQRDATALYRHGMARHGTSRHATARHSTSQHVTARHGTARICTARHGIATARHGHTPPRHTTPRRAAPRHATPRHATPCCSMSWRTYSHQEMYPNASSSFDRPGAMCFVRFRGRTGQSASFIVVAVTARFDLAGQVKKKTKLHVLAHFNWLYFNQNATNFVICVAVRGVTCYRTRRGTRTFTVEGTVIAQHPPPYF